MALRNEQALYQRAPYPLGMGLQSTLQNMYEGVGPLGATFGALNAAQTEEEAKWRQRLGELQNWQGYQQGLGSEAEARRQRDAENWRQGAYGQNPNTISGDWGVMQTINPGNIQIPDIFRSGITIPAFNGNLKVYQFR